MATSQLIPIAEAGAVAVDRLQGTTQLRLAAKCPLHPALSHGGSGGGAVPQLTGTRNGPSMQLRLQGAFVSRKSIV